MYKSYLDNGLDGLSLRGPQGLVAFSPVVYSNSLAADMDVTPSDDSDLELMHVCSVCGEDHRSDDHDEMVAVSRIDDGTDTDADGPGDDASAPSFSSAGDDYAGDASTTGVATLGGQVTGTIEVDGDADWFALTVTAGMTYVIDLFPNSSSGGDGLFDTFLALYSESGSLLGSNDNFDGLNAQITFTATTDMTVYISAEGSRGDTGDYVLEVGEPEAPDPDPNFDPTNAVEVAIGGRAAGTLDASGEYDFFEIDVVAGQSYTIFLIRDTADALDNPMLSLYDANGVLIEQNDDVAQFDWNSRIDFTATATGTMYLSAASTNGDNTNFGGADPTGGYTLYVEESDERADFTVDEVANFLVNSFSPFAGSWGSDTITYDVSTLPVEAQTLAIMAMQLWADLTPLTFVEAAPNAAANIVFQDTVSGRAYATSLGPDENGQVTINVASDWSGGLSNDTAENIDDYTFQTYIHEVGHALGLGHSGSYNASQSNPISYEDSRLYNQDHWNSTVMSYFSQGEAGAGNTRFALTPQQADIIAIQSLYGGNTTTRNGDTVYGFNSTETGSVYDFAVFQSASGRPPAITLFDTGGTDMLDLSGYTGDQEINLYAETAMTVGGTADNSSTFANVITIARGTVIENAEGGSGNDTMTGNTADNVLRGNEGEDVLFGQNGNDTLEGGDGDDELYGQNGNDILYGDAGADVLIGGSGDDSLDGGIGDDVLNGQDGDDVLNGGSGHDSLTGGTGNDTLLGESGNDVLNGQDGDDLIYGGAG
ncbi:MAG: M10 family metallopeptidase C-terminal domain-containing protein, partial [Litorimonas sp.]